MTFLIGDNRSPGPSSGVSYRGQGGGLRRRTSAGGGGDRSGGRTAGPPCRLVSAARSGRGTATAFKGISAAEEVRSMVKPSGCSAAEHPTIHRVAWRSLDPATVVQVVREREKPPVRACRKGRDETGDNRRVLRCGPVVSGGTHGERAASRYWLADYGRRVTGCDLALVPGRLVYQRPAPTGSGGSGPLVGAATAGAVRAQVGGPGGPYPSGLGWPSTPGTSLTPNRPVSRETLPSEVAVVGIPKPRMEPDEVSGVEPRCDDPPPGHFFQRWTVVPHTWSRPNRQERYCERPCHLLPRRANFGRRSTTGGAVR